MWQVFPSPDCQRAPDSKWHTPVLSFRSKVCVLDFCAYLRIPALCLGLLFCTPLYAQSTASVEGLVTDPNGAAVLAAEITVIARDIGVKRVVMTDTAGRYQIFALPLGFYRVEIRAAGFRTQIVENLTVQVGRTVT